MNIPDRLNSLSDLEGVAVHEIANWASQRGLTGWLFGERDRGDSMRPVNGMFLYRMGALQQLFAMADGVDAIVYEPLFKRSIEIADRFIEAPENVKDLPNSVAYLQSIRQWLDKLCQEIKANAKVPMNFEVRIGIAHAVNRFQNSLEQELGEAHTYILEDKRGYPPKTLLHTETLINPKVLPYLSEFVRYNLDDAGAALVFDRFTACGYHTLRAVEDVARRYYELVTDRQAATQKAHGISYHTLGQIAQELGQLLAKRKEKHLKSGHLPLIAPVLEALCEIYRNPLAHPEIVVLEEQDAIDTFNKGIDLISTMIRDVLEGGPHFGFLWLFMTQRASLGFDGADNSKHRKPTVKRVDAGDAQGLQDPRSQAQGRVSDAQEHGQKV